MSSAKVKTSKLHPVAYTSWGSRNGSPVIDSPTLRYQLSNSRLSPNESLALTAVQNCSNFSSLASDDMKSDSIAGSSGVRLLVKTSHSDFEPKQTCSKSGSGNSDRFSVSHVVLTACLRSESSEGDSPIEFWSNCCVMT